MTDYCFREASISEVPQIWNILKDAIQRRKEDRSNQWQDGYPNPEVISEDIEKNGGFVLTLNNEIVGYCAIFVNDEPEYENIVGKWMTNDDFIVFHRLAVAQNQIGKGLAQKMFDAIETHALSKNIKSIKADTNFDNPSMLNIFEKMGYVYCGEVYFRGSPRKAFEKVLAST